MCKLSLRRLLITYAVAMFLTILITDPAESLCNLQKNSEGVSTASAAGFSIKPEFLARHDGPVMANTIATIGGAMGLSYLFHSRNRSWPLKGALSFSVPSALIGTIVGFAATGASVDGRSSATMMGVGFGAIGGFIGHNVGKGVAQGNRGSKSVITVMTALSIPAAILIYKVHFAIGDW